MQTLTLPYGLSHIELNLSPYYETSPDVINAHSNQNQVHLGKREIVKRIDCAEYRFNNSRNTAVAIAINDPTRPIPYDLILHPLLDILQKQQIPAENITLFIATGTHRSPTPDELDKMLPLSIRNKYRTIVHDCDDMENLDDLGVSRAGSPIFINRGFNNADVKIVTGHIEPHHFMGYSGGVKSAVIGLGGRKTIEHNHHLLTDPGAKMGLFQENPMRSDVEEIGRIINVDLALNVVLDDEKKIVDVFFGHPSEVMRKGIALSKSLCELSADRDYDLVICSAGGYPKDINLYQAQKAITHACTFVKDRGVILLVAECCDGLGSDAFGSFLIGKRSPAEIIHAFENTPFSIGPHKAYQLALQAKDHRIILLSGMVEHASLSPLLRQAGNIEEGIKMSREYLPSNAKVAILPYATHVMNTILGS